jgi:hypothetical protein
MCRRLAATRSNITSALKIIIDMVSNAFGAKYADSDLLKNFYQDMKDNGSSENYQKATLLAMMHVADLLSKNFLTFFLRLIL